MAQNKNNLTLFNLYFFQHHQNIRIVGIKSIALKLLVVELAENYHKFTQNMTEHK